MKKIGIYFGVFLLVCFILPIIFTKKAEETSSSNDEEINQNIEEANDDAEKYQYNKYATIKLLHTATNEIEEIALDDYLCNVVSAEMPADYELEALKAQAIVARTYTIYQIINNGGKHEGADMCDSSNCCQAWISKEDRLAKWDEAVREENWNKITSAVEETAGEIITYQGEPIDAFFHSNSGGTTEIPVNVWGGSDYPYLQSVETAGEEGYTQYSSDATFSQEELVNKLKEKYPEVEIDFSASDSIQILEHTDSGRVKTVKFGNIQISGVEVRSIFELKSTNFEISQADGNISFSVKGYGHGVGLSQTGSDSMAKNGSNYEEIIKHFYTGVEITEVNNL